MASGKNCCEHGNDAYSYQTCIRTMLGNTWVLNRTKYSTTTSRHQNLYISYLRGIDLTNVPQGASADTLRALAQAKLDAEEAVA